MFYSKTATRIEEHTRDSVNERIRQATDERIARCAAAPEEDISRRLDELDSEWDVERAIELNAAGAMIGGLLLGRLAHKGFYAFCGIAAAAVAQHVLQGWSPVLPVIRRLGFRTEREIERERHAMEIALRTRMLARRGARGVSD